MRKFLSILALCFILPAMAAAESEGPVREALKAFREPMQQLVREAAKGKDADLAAIGKSYAEAKTAWFKVTAETLDLNQYGVPADQQEEVWRQVRTLSLAMGYLDEAVRRSDRTLALRSAAMLPSAYDKVAAALNVPRSP